MLRKEDFMVIQALVERGVYQKDVAEQLGVHPKTVSRALKRGSVRERPSRVGRNKLDPYKKRVEGWLQEGIWNAVVILRKLEEEGYTGRISIVRDYIRPRRALRKSRATVRFETPPGRQLQSDWGRTETRIGGKKQRVEFIVNTLSYSRRFHFWCTDSQDAEHTYEGLVRGFEYFSGVPREVLVDNQRVAVSAHRPGERPVFHPAFVDLAAHYGFEPRACRPMRAQTKGKDERMVGYIKHHFFVRYREFESWEHLNQVAEKWLEEEADRRVQGTVKEVVAERFRRELPHLRPLPQRRFDTSYKESRLVSWDSYIEVRGNRYSVPAELAGERVEIRLSLEDDVKVFFGEQMVASHRLKRACEGWGTVPAHHQELWRRAGVQTRRLEEYEEASRWNS